MQPKLGSGGRRLLVPNREVEGFSGRRPHGRVSHSPGRCSAGPGTHTWPEAGQLLSPEPWSSHCCSVRRGFAPDRRGSAPARCHTQCAGRVASTYHIHRAEDVAVMVARLQVLGDVGKGAQVLWVLGRAGNIPDLMLCDDVLREKRLCSARHQPRASAKRHFLICSLAGWGSRVAPNLL